MKKLMLLGGSRYLIPIIEIAHKLDVYVITADYLPENIAHKYADEYHNVSVMEKDVILNLAKHLDIKGILSFACDPGVLTAAYVAEQMGLPFQCSYKSAAILQDKGMFRQFLRENRFNVPHAKRYMNKEAPFKDINFFTWPIIVKPVDSAGSKGVTRVDTIEQLEFAIDIALQASHGKAFIIEDFLEFEGYHSSTDFFTVDGEVKFSTYSDQLFDPEADNPYTPSIIIWPSSMKEKYQNYLTKEIQRLMNLLKMKTGIYNIETCVGNNGKAYIMEVSPRGGGCKIAELQKMAYGNDLIECEVRKAVGLPLNEIKQTDCVNHWCEFVVHTRKGQNGILKTITIDSDIKEKYIKSIDISAKRGDIVMAFSGANMSLGDIFLCFNSREALDKIMNKSNDWINIEIE